MTIELLELIKEKFPCAKGVRFKKGSIDIQILDDPKNDISWIPYYQCPVNIEKLIDKWYVLGGRIKEWE